jgi:4-amino-4-deoxy-L-arabinose transferase-like glycosyltransferase
MGQAPASERSGQQPRSRDSIGSAIAAFAVMALCGLLFFSRLGSRALWSSEGRWAEVAREMVLTSNYFWPTINGHLYYDKPLLSYWFVAAAAHLTGAMDERAARLPCAIAGLLGVGLLIGIGRLLYNLRVGAAAGFVLATSFSFVFLSRHASADVETVTGEIAALLLYLVFGPGGGAWVIALWIVMAVASLTKGLLGFALPLLVIGAYSLFRDGWHALWTRVSSGPPGKRLRWAIDRNRWIVNWFSLPAIAIGFAMYYAPFAISHSRMGSNAGIAMVLRENLVRFFEPFDHRGPIYLYAYVIFALMAPWSVLLPAGLTELQLRRRLSAGQASSNRFVQVWFWATFVFFTLSGSRRSYYLLPILPPAAILVARLTTEPAASLTRWARRLMGMGYAVVAGAAALSILILLPASLRPGQLATLPDAPEKAVFAVIWIIAMASIAYAVAQRPGFGIATSMYIIAYLSLLYIFVFALPAVDHYRSERAFAYRVREQLGGDLSGLAFYNDVGPVFYLDSPTPIPNFDEPRKLADSVAHNRTRWIIVRHRDAEQIGAIRGQIVATETIFPWEGSTESASKQILIRVDPR